MKTAYEKVNEFCDIIEQYSVERGIIPPAEQATRIYEYLDLSPDDILNYTKSEFSTMAADISSYCFKLQNEINIQRTKIKRCKTEIYRLGSNSDEAQEYLDYQSNSEAFLCRWEWIGQRLEVFADRLRDLTFNRKW